MTPKNSPGLVPRTLLIPIALHFVILALFFFDVIRDPYHQPGTLLFHHGGDDREYFKIATLLLQGNVPETQYTLGYPLLLVPWIVVLRPSVITELTGPMVVFHAGILFPLTQIILYHLTFRLTRQRLIAWLAALFWALMPAALYAGVATIHSPDLAAIWAVHLPWLQMLSDPPSAFLTVLSFWMLFRCLDSARPSQQIFWAELVGMVAGIAVLTRMNSLLTVGATILILVLARRWLNAIIVGTIMLLIFSPQVLYNLHFFGSPLTTGYQALTTPPQGLFNLSYPLNILTSKYSVLAIAGVIGLVLFLALGLRMLWQTNRFGAIAVGAWVVGYLIFFSLYYYSWDGGMTRFLIPAWPWLLLLSLRLWSLNWRERLERTANSVDHD